MESAVKKELSPLKPRYGGQVVTSEKFRRQLQLSGDSQRKREFFLHLQTILGTLRQPEVNRYEFAYNIQLFFEEVVFFETGINGLRSGLRLLLDKLYADPITAKMIRYIFKQMQKCLTADRPDNGCFERERVLSAMQEIFSWYTERVHAIEKMVSAAGVTSGCDQIFSLKVLHDQESHDVLGFEVNTGLALFGRAGQNLWFKVFVKLGGEYILPHIDWNSWIDDTEIFTVRRPGEAAALSVIIPILPRTQRLMIENLSAFIPYQALDLHPGKHEVEVEACLFNEKGDCLLSASSAEAISVARNYRPAEAVISQQALGMWSRDFVSGDSINSLEVSCVREPLGNWLSDLIRVRMDLEVYDRLDQDMAIEVRFYDAEGTLVKCASDTSQDPYLALRKEMRIDEIVFRLYDLELVVPRAQLILEDDQKVLACEVCLMSPDSKVIVGSFSHFKLQEIDCPPAATLDKIVVDEAKGKARRGFVSRLFRRS